MRTTRLRSVTVFILMIAGATITATGAEANNFGLGGGIYYADSSFHPWAGSSLTSIGDDVATFGAAKLNSQTDITAAESSSFSGADVQVVDDTYVGTYAARVSCLSFVSGLYANTCDQWRMYINLDAPGAPSTGMGANPSSGYRTAVGCHEMGHTVGLRHTTSSTSCMKNPADTPRQDYNSHDRAHVNSFY